MVTRFRHTAKLKLLFPGVVSDFSTDLFSMYTADVHETSNTNLAAYADDTAKFFHREMTL